MMNRIEQDVKVFRAQNTIQNWAANWKRGAAWRWVLWGGLVLESHQSGVSEKLPFAGHVWHELRLVTATLYFMCQLIGTLHAYCWKKRFIFCWSSIDVAERYLRTTSWILKPRFVEAFRFLRNSSDFSDSIDTPLDGIRTEHQTGCRRIRVSLRYLDFLVKDDPLDDQLVKLTTWSTRSVGQDLESNNLLINCRKGR